MVMAFAITFFFLCGEHMAKNRELRIRISGRQHEIIKNYAEIEGKSISTFSRERILTPSHKTEMMIREIHDNVVNKEKLK